MAETFTELSHIQPTADWFFASEMPEDACRFNAGSKARTDVETIFARMGLTRISVESIDSADREKGGVLEKLSMHRTARNHWIAALGDLHDCVLFIQFPLVSHSMMLDGLFAKLAANNVTIVLFIHDAESFRSAADKRRGAAQRTRLWLEERTIINHATYVIVHNERMAEVAIEVFGLSRERIIPLGIFDYLVDDDDMYADTSQDAPIVVAGNLVKKKAEYLYGELPAFPINLYGNGYDYPAVSGRTYFGPIEPDALPGELVGSFGLVWDGPSAETCAGVYGAYMKINNPHKTSLYLASGLPVIVWDQAALAAFVDEEQVGLSVSSLWEIPNAIATIDQAQYEGMRQCAMRVSERLRTGWYTQQAVSKVIEAIKRNARS